MKTDYQGEWHVIVRTSDPDFDDVDLDVWHPATCEKHAADPGWPGIMWNCGMGDYLADVSVEDEMPKDGIYLARTWSRMIPATPNHGDEWDGGVEIKEMSQ